MGNIESNSYEKSNKTQKKYVKTPWPIFIFQWVFLALICLLTVVELPMGPFGLPWHTFIVNWISFIVLVVTAFAYIYYKNKKEEN